MSSSCWLPSMMISRIANASALWAYTTARSPSQARAARAIPNSATCPARRIQPRRRMNQPPRFSRAATARSRQLLLGSVRRGFFGAGLRRFLARSVGAAFLATFVRAAFFGAGFRVDFSRSGRLGCNVLASRPLRRLLLLGRLLLDWLLPRRLLPDCRWGTPAVHRRSTSRSSCTGARDVSGPERDHDVAWANSRANRFGQILPVFHQRHVPMPVRANRLGQSTRIGPFDWFFARGVDLGQE